MEFAPKIHAEDFRTFWSAGSGWGKFSQKSLAGHGQSVDLAVASGNLTLRELAVTLPPSLVGKSVKTVGTVVGGSTVAAPLVKKDKLIGIFA